MTSINDTDEGVGGVIYWLPLNNTETDEGANADADMPIYPEAVTS